MAKLKVFKNHYLTNLETSISSNLDHYMNADSLFFLGDNSGILESSYDIPDTAPTLDWDKDMDESENSIRLFEYLSQIDNTAASDPRLWAYLSHVTFCEYAVKRWNLDTSTEPEKVIAKRFFTNGSARSLRHQAISRLWWGTRLTIAPWENNSFFEPIEKDDKYYYTKVLMQDESISSDLIERPNIASSPELLITILDFLDNNPEFRKRELWREFMKEITLTLGYRKIMALDLRSLQTELNDIAFEIKRRLTQ